MLTKRMIRQPQNKIVLFFFFLLIASCGGMKNSTRQSPENEKEGYFFKVRDGMEIFIREYAPTGENRKTIYLISGITGINHKSEEEIIDLLSNNENRIVVIHPQGTGYSEGTRGDTDPETIFADYCEIIKADNSYTAGEKKIFLFGHIMSCAFALEVAGKLQEVHGLILVNPPYKMKPAKGMSPRLLDYIKYTGYYVFAPHTPVVNMAGDPSIISDESDRIESEQRNNDSLLVKYFNIRCMVESKKIVNTIIKNASVAEFPLLLLYGENDNIVDKSGCDEIFAAWNWQNKKYAIIPGGSHGKSTVFIGSEFITEWVESL